MHLKATRKLFPSNSNFQIFNVGPFADVRWSRLNFPVDHRFESDQNHVYKELRQLDLEAGLDGYRF